MLGHRGCRLCITYPEILDMQVRAIIEAACECAAAGREGLPGDHDPADHRQEGTADPGGSTSRSPTPSSGEAGVKRQVPGRHHDRSAAGGPAGRPDRRGGRVLLLRHQRPDPDDHGLPRDDAGKFLPDYVDEKKAASSTTTPSSPSTRTAWACWSRWASRRAARRGPNLKIGICGEHGGEPKSVEFCHRVGMNYVSCSPFRVPIARLGAAQARIKAREASAEGAPHA